MSTSLHASKHTVSREDSFSVGSLGDLRDPSCLKHRSYALAKVYNAHARMLERHVLLKLALYTAGSAIALTGAVPMLVLPHAVTAGALLYIEQEYLIAGKPE